MYRTEINPDDLQNAAIQRRRLLDQERKARIFDDKTRTIGVDVDALNAQVSIKKDTCERNLHRDIAYDRYIQATTNILQKLDSVQEKKRRDDLVALTEFRKNHQKRTQRREYDLYDPKALEKDAPARTSDFDSRCRVSGLQVFIGEDLGQEERAKKQKDQMKSWVQRQIWEKQEMKKAQQEEARKHAEKERLLALNAATLEKAVKDARCDKLCKDTEFNLKLVAAEKKQREADQELKTQQENLEEITKNLNGSFLRETPTVISPRGHKIQVALFKGMTADQRREILAIQSKQRQEYEDKLEKERNEQAQWAIQEAAANKAGYLLQRERERQLRQQAIELRKINEKKSLEDKKRQEYFDKELYINPPTDAYFAQFSTTSR